MNLDFLKNFCELNRDANLNGCELNREITVVNKRRVGFSAFLQKCLLFIDCYETNYRRQTYSSFSCVAVVLLRKKFTEIYKKYTFNNKDVQTFVGYP